MKRWLFKVICCLLLILTACVILIKYAFRTKTYQKAGHPAHAHWIHRGLYDNKMVFENTIAAFDSARKMNITGIELDLFYIDSLHNFYVTHDLPNGFGLPPLLLSEVIEKYDTSFSYWFDLKNLTEENMERIHFGLLEIVPGEVLKKVFIESAEADALGYLAESGFNTIYWIQYNRENWIKKAFKKLFIQWKFVRYKYVGGTTAATLADEDFFTTFDPVPKFIFHIYTPQQYNSLQSHDNVAVYLMDYIPDHKK